MNILFPIETIAREFDSRLVLAVQLAGGSRRVFIGQHALLHDLVLRSPLRGGVYLGKHLMRRKTEETQAKYRSFKERDFSIAFLHEEGGIFAGDENYWRKQLDSQVDPSILAADDHILTWGEFQAEHYRQSHPQGRARVTPVGHPRFDLLKPHYRQYYDEQVDRIREKYGKYFLLNTNFTVANNVSGLQDTFSSRLGYCADNPDSRIEASETWAHRLRTLSHFVVLAHKLSVSFPDYRVILRPHPSENINFYKTCLAGVGNITVTQTGPVGPWLLGAELLVHDGCTTAIEAHFAGTPTINFKPESDVRFDLRIPNEFGLRCTAVDEVIDQVRTWQSGKKESATGTDLPSATARHMLANFSADSVEPLLEILASSAARNDVVTPSERQLRARERKQRRRKDRKTASKQKFPGFTRDTIEAGVSGLSRLFQRQARVKFYGPNLLEVYVKH